ncbi:MAG: 50S ribosomal protein L19, partial [Elusimicrobia bacterium]|nr:50S ribosomal protein L19 [Elusimicrobiota bacterium]
MMTIKQEGLKTNLPAFKPGDNVRVSVRVVEGDNERVQYFDGVVIGRKGSGKEARRVPENQLIGFLPLPES